MLQGLLCWVMGQVTFFSIRHSDVIAYFVRTDNENPKTSLQATGITSVNYLKMKLSLSIFSTSSKGITGKCLCFPICRLQYPKQFSPSLSPKIQSWHYGKSFHNTYITLYRLTPCSWTCLLKNDTAEHVRKDKKAVLQTGVSRQCGFTFDVFIKCFHPNLCE